MHPDLNPLEAGEILNNVTRLEAPATIDGRVGTQLSQPTDVQAARNYFQTSGGQAQLPDLSFDSAGSTSGLGGGHEMASMHGLTGTGAEAALANPTVPGLDQGLLPGLEHGLAGVMPPGGEPISPLIQMILKMPGLTGLVGDFFSALMAFFFPTDGGGLLALLDPSMWAAAAQDALTGMATMVMHDLPLTLTTMGTNNPFQTMLQNGLLDGSKAATSAASPVTLSLEHQPFNAQSLNVGGSVGPGTNMYEMSSMDGSSIVDGNAANIDWSQSNKFIAMENGNSFGPTLGGSTVPTAQMQGQAPQIAPQLQPQAPSGGDAAMQQQPAAQAVEGRGSLMNNDGTAGSGTEIAQAPEAPAHHVVERGDNLWNIAKENLGSGQRWTEIYDLNKDVIGNNPDLIYGGTDLKLPGGAENVASGAQDYMVKSGDNLWNIARDHMGGGQNWHAIYDQNAATIGSNPDLIHPGQNLAIPDGGTHMQVAHGTPATHATASHTGATHGGTPHTAHHAGAAQHHGNSQPHTQNLAHHAKPAAPDATAHSATPSSQEVAQQAGDSAASQAAHAGAKTEELGKTALAPADLKQEIGLKAVAKSL